MVESRKRLTRYKTALLRLESKSSPKPARFNFVVSHVHKMTKHIAFSKLFPDNDLLPAPHSTMDQTPTALFNSYEQDFRHIVNSISEKLEGNGKNQLGGEFTSTVVSKLASYSSSGTEQRKAALRKVEIELDEADDIVCLYSRLCSPGYS